MFRPNRAPVAVSEAGSRPAAPTRTALAMSKSIDLTGKVSLLQHMIEACCCVVCSSLAYFVAGSSICVSQVHRTFASGCRSSPFRPPWVPAPLFDRGMLFMFIYVACGREKLALRAGLPFQASRSSTTCPQTRKSAAIYFIRLLQQTGSKPAATCNLAERMNGWVLDSGSICKSHTFSQRPECALQAPINTTALFLEGKPKCSENAVVHI